jgi:AraC-like DNA-binding protein
MQVLSSTQDSRRPTIAQLAFSTGFENERVFSRAFKRKYGINPSATDANSASVASQEQTSKLLSWMKEL